MRGWYRLNLTSQEKASLQSTIYKRKANAPAVVRSQVLLAIAENGANKTDREASALFALSTRSIERLRKCCCEEGVERAVEGKKREVFREKKMTGEVEAKLTMLACSSVPEGYSKWTLQLLADKMVELNYIDSISHTLVGTTLKKMRLNPGSSRCG
jgi:hypothetical protein